MIRKMTAADLAALRPDSEAAVRLLGRAAAYGIDRPFAPFWRAGDSSFLSVLDGQAVLAGGADEEIEVFIRMNPDICGLRTNRDAAARLAGTSRIETGAVMTPGSGIHKPSMRPEPLTPREAFPVLEACFDGLRYDAWYADISHRIRHHCCRIVGFKENGRAVACAMTVAECRGAALIGAALIGAVATLPEGRGRGYASANVLYLAETLAGEGRRVLLSPKNDAAHRLYERIGFTVCGEWGQIDYE